MKPDNKKPFGLQIATKTAAKALKDGKVPSSIILYNLLVLQKEVFFPKDLDEDYFHRPLKFTHDNDKRVVSKLLDEIKKPQVNISDLLEATISEGWVKKKSPPIKVEAPVKKFTQKPRKVMPKANTAKVEPVIVIKKNKLSN